MVERKELDLEAIDRRYKENEENPENWRGHWKSKIGYAQPSKIRIRGYDLADLIGNLSYAETVYLTLKGELPSENEAKMLEALFGGIIDHGFRTHISAARFAVSGNPDVMAGIIAGLSTLGVNTAGTQKFVIEFVNEAYEFMKKENLTIEEAAKRIVERSLKEKRIIPGYGTKLRHEMGYDPRAVKLGELAVKYGIAEGEKFKLYEAIHAEFEKVRGKTVLNVDGMQGIIMCQMGFTPQEAVGLEAIVMLPGIIAHSLEEIETQKKDRIFNRYLPGLLTEYVGVPDREFPKERKRG